MLAYDLPVIFLQQNKTMDSLKQMNDVVTTNKSGAILLKPPIVKKFMMTQNKMAPDLFWDFVSDDTVKVRV